MRYLCVALRYEYSWRRVPELERPGKVRTAPIAVDHRKEVNSIRGHLTAGTSKSKDRSSPSSYGTPKGFRSPLSSPLVGNAAQVSCASYLGPSQAMRPMESSDLKGCPIGGEK